MAGRSEDEPCGSTRGIGQGQGQSLGTDKVVARWVIDYYVYSAMAAFRDGLYVDFCQIRDVMQDMIVRPFEQSEEVTIKLRLMQFMSRINDGENLSYLFDSEGELTPLESAFRLLHLIDEEVVLPQDLVGRVSNSIREMVMIVKSLLRSPAVLIQEESDDNDDSISQNNLVPRKRLNISSPVREEKEFWNDDESLFNPRRGHEVDLRRDNVG
ncbi:UNVERIFIED_CONTAM: hypothetical protein FKN15_033184 [Acipenser sinensis]